MSTDSSNLGVQWNRRDQAQLFPDLSVVMSMYFSGWAFPCFRHFQGLSLFHMSFKTFWKTTVSQSPGRRQDDPKVRENPQVCKPSGLLCFKYHKSQHCRIQIASRPFPNTTSLSMVAPPPYPQNPLCAFRHWSFKWGLLQEMQGFMFDEVTPHLLISSQLLGNCRDCLPHVTCARKFGSQSFILPFSRLWYAFCHSWPARSLPSSLCTFSPGLHMCLQLDFLSCMTVPTPF